MHRSTQPEMLLLVSDHGVTNTSWTDVTPRARTLPLVHYLRILPANVCELIADD